MGQRHARLLASALTLLLAGHGTASLAGETGYRLFGDLRLRGEMDGRQRQAGVDNSENGPTETRNRLRYRARVGVVFEPDPRWSGRLRLATSSNQNSPHVSFVTLGDSADLRIGVDIASIVYTGVESLKLKGGKTPLDFWRQTEVFWDADINPEGLAAVYRRGPLTLNATWAAISGSNWSSAPEAMSAWIGQVVVEGGRPWTLALGGASLDGGAGVYHATRHVQLAARLRQGRWQAGAEYLRSNAGVEDTAWVAQLRYRPGPGPGLRAYVYHVEAWATPGDGTFTQDNFPSARPSADNFHGYRLQLDYPLGRGASLDLRWYASRIITRNLDRSDIDGDGNPDRQDARNRRLQLNINLSF